MTDASPQPPDGRARELPSRRRGAPAPGEKRRRYLRWKRISSVAALVLLTALVVLLAGFFRDQTEDEASGATRALLRDLGGALEAHHRRVGALPARIAELVNPNSPYRGAPIPEDAWRNLIEYRAVDLRRGTYRLRSWGADGRAGTRDDLIWPEDASWD